MKMAITVAHNHYKSSSIRFLHNSLVQDYLTRLLIYLSDAIVGRCEPCAGAELVDELLIGTYENGILDMKYRTRFCRTRTDATHYYKLVIRYFSFATVQ